MAPRHRKSAMKVRDGRVAKKNNWVADDRSIHERTQDEIRIERRDPGSGHRHLITVADLRAFLALLPDWDEVSIGLDAIVLDGGGQDAMGWHYDGVVAVCAWERDLWDHDVSPSWFAEHAQVIATLGVDVARQPRGRIELRWTEEQARAFQLLHILPHELGHHHDRITTRSRAVAARGEPYAERYALQVMEAIWPLYADRFAT